MKIAAHFIFTRQERRGIFVFFLLTGLFLILMEFWENDQFSDQLPPDIISFSVDKNVSKEHQEEGDLYFNSEYRKKDINATSALHQTYDRFVFNPNQISFDSLVLLGFKNYAARNLVNYVKKGGYIKDRAKLLSIYGIDSSLIYELEPFITFAGKQPETDPKSLSSAQNRVKKIGIRMMDLNTADSLQLDSVPGVGPYTVSRILGVRRKLGGFLNVSQLLEFGVVRDSSYEKLSSYFIASKENIKPININTASFHTFIRHPYFTKEITSAILKYRKQHGPFTNPQEISRIKAISEETGQRIIPYITVAESQLQK